MMLNVLLLCFTFAVVTIDGQRRSTPAPPRNINLAKDPRLKFNAQYKCLDRVDFYRDPDRKKDTAADLIAECNNMFRCSNGIVYKTICAPGTYFNVIRQSCEVETGKTIKQCNYDTADDFKPATTPMPQVNLTCPQPNNMACASGICIPNDRFCDNVNNCGDWSDELLCSPDTDPLAALFCDPTKCRLPDCYCTADQVPGGLSLDDIPQMIVLQFEEAINTNNIPLYNDLLYSNGTRLNPNGCGLKATFFLTHVYTDYRATKKLFLSGNEIALMGVDNERDEQWWTRAPMDRLEKEYTTERQIVSKFGEFPDDRLRGMRVPFFKGDGNAQFQMMSMNSFAYDSSIAVEPRANPIWPYTLDYRIPHLCYPPKIAQCPTRSFPGVWEVPLNSMINMFQESCPSVSQCIRTDDADETERTLEMNFQRNYAHGKAPLVLVVSTSWMTPSHRRGLVRWVDKLLAEKRKDVWFVTTSQMLDWVRHPKKVADLGSLDSWKCPGPVDPRAVCKKANGCALDGANEQMRSGYMVTCAKCPSFYPDLNIPDGEVLVVDETISPPVNALTNAAAPSPSV